MVERNDKCDKVGKPEEKQDSLSDDLSNFCLDLLKLHVTSESIKHRVEQGIADGVVAGAEFVGEKAKDFGVAVKDECVDEAKRKVGGALATWKLGKYILGELERSAEEFAGTPETNVAERSKH